MESPDVTVGAFLCKNPNRVHFIDQTTRFNLFHNIFRPIHNKYLGFCRSGPTFVLYLRFSVFCPKANELDQRISVWIFPDLRLTKIFDLLTVQPNLTNPT